MSSSTEQVHPTVQRFAALTCAIALLPISVGALVTTLKAGMAFADWPTSDGHNMLLYPWLRDLRHTDKFVEHGHRLAGMLIGIVSIALVVVTFRKEKRFSVRAGAVAILIAVIAQGLLGGMRVRMDEQVLAMTHSITGGLFFTLCFCFALFIRGNVGSDDDTRLNPSSFAITLVLPIVVLGQYLLGGMFRHLGRMLHEHVAGAVVVTLLSILVAAALVRSDLQRIRSRGKWLLAALVVQISLGLGSWVTKLGVPAWGWVAVRNSPAQNIICSLHTVGGMFLLAASTTAAIEVLIQFRAGRLRAITEAFESSGGAAQHGGLA